jgi:hypothetical protein
MKEEMAFTAVSLPTANLPSPLLEPFLLDFKQLHYFATSPTSLLHIISITFAPHTYLFPVLLLLLLTLDTTNSQ